VQGLAEKAERVHVLMNNCYQDFAVRNARRMGELLGASREPPSGQAKLL
jgi:uncharacterized protein YecE (DUF72 family)